MMGRRMGRLSSSSFAGTVSSIGVDPGAYLRPGDSIAQLADLSEIEIEVAEMLAAMIPSAEKVRFANTGTEAAMAALHLARGYTGRPKFIKFEGHYHGWHDDFLVGAHPQPAASLGHRRDPIAIPDSSGLNRRSLEDTDP